MAEKDFDLQRESGRVNLRAVTRDFTAEVVENYMEIHLFWAGKGTCCVPAQATYGPLISAISATPSMLLFSVNRTKFFIFFVLDHLYIFCAFLFLSDFTPTVSNRPPGSKKNRTGLIVGIVLSVSVAAFLSVFALYYIFQKRKRQKNLEDEGMI